MNPSESKAIFDAIGEIRAAHALIENMRQGRFGVARNKLERAESLLHGLFDDEKPVTDEL
jgi:hypothetical protein